MNDLYGFVGDTSLIPESEYYGDCMPCEECDCKIIIVIRSDHAIFLIYWQKKCTYTIYRRDAVMVVLCYSQSSIPIRPSIIVHIVVTIKKIEARII